MKLFTPRIRVVLILLIAIILALLWWLYNHSFITVTINGDPDEATITIVNQSSEEIFTTQISNGRFRKLVPKGEYEIKINSDSKSFFSVIRTGPYLTTSRVDASLNPEKERTFVGDDPKPCMRLVSSVLISYACNSTFSNLVTHMPANDSRATYVLKPYGLLNGFIEGVVTSPEGTIIIVKADEVSEEGDPHTAFYINEKAELSYAFSLNELSPDATYEAMEHEDGFVMFNKSSGEMVYYLFNDMNNPKKFSSKSKKLKSTVPFKAATGNGKIVRGFSSTKNARLVNLDDQSTSDSAQMSLIVSESEEEKELIFNKFISDFDVCGENYLCILAGNDVEVYDIRNEKPTRRFTVTRANGFIANDSRLIVYRENEIVFIDTQTGKGYIDYRYGQYTGCGISPASNGYLLCVIDLKNQKHALHISDNNLEDHPVDDLYHKISRLPGVRNISIYRNNIIFSPNPGEPEYNPTSKVFEYNQDKIKKLNTVIRQSILNLEFDKNRYSIHSSFN